MIRGAPVLAWVRDEDDEPGYRVVMDRIRSTAAVLPRTLQQARPRG